MSTPQGGTTIWLSAETKARLTQVQARRTLAGVSGKNTPDALLNELLDDYETKLAAFEQAAESQAHNA